VVSAFYVSNVEAWLAGVGPVAARATGSPEKIRAFYESVAMLPVDSSSLYIRFIGAPSAGNLAWWRGAWLQSVSPMMDVRTRVRSGTVPTCEEALRMIPDPKMLVR